MNQMSIIMNGPLNQMTHSIHSNTWIYSVTKHRCVLHSLRLFKPHPAQHKYIINRRLHWMPLKLESFSRETTCILAYTVSVRVAVTSLPVPLAIIGSARNRQDVRLTGRSPIRAGHARNRPIPITGRSIDASLIYIHNVINIPNL